MFSYQCRRDETASKSTKIYIPYFILGGGTVWPTEGDESNEGDGVVRIQTLCVYLPSLVFLPVDIKHSQCPCRFFNPRKSRHCYAVSRVNNAMPRHPSTIRDSKIEKQKKNRKRNELINEKKKRKRKDERNISERLMFMHEPGRDGKMLYWGQYHQR